MRRTRMRVIAVLTLGLFAAPLAAEAQKYERRSAYWPTEDWRSSTPEQQGIDSELLAAMFEDMQNRRLNLCSVLIVRNGYAVVEAYFGTCHGNKTVRVFSVTKSVTSALVGIAIDKGHIDGVDHRVLDYFPQRTVAHLDSRKRAVTLGHLLKMTSRLHWIEFPGDRTRAQMEASENWVQFVLDRPMRGQPGTKWNYNSGTSHLLSAILQRATGMTALSFAEEHLLGPLGISNAVWLPDPQGISNAGFGMRLTSRDMAKFGYLYLNGGVWDGKQVVPTEWVDVSTKEHSRHPPSFPAEAEGYGYQWWTNSGPPYRYFAVGYAGQVIWVSPDLELVGVLTGYWDWREALAPVVRNLINAARSSEPLPESPRGVALLESRIEELKQRIPFREGELWRGPYLRR